MITAAGVRKILPHRYPLLLVDRVDRLVPGERLEAVKAVTCNEPWYQRLGTDPAEEDLAYPPVLLMESWAQSAGILALASHPDAEALADLTMLFGSAAGLVFHRAVYPGDVLEHRVRLIRVLSDAAIAEGRIEVAGKPVLTVERAVLAFRPAQELPSAGN